MGLIVIEPRLPQKIYPDIIQCKKCLKDYPKEEYSKRWIESKYWLDFACKKCKAANTRLNKAKTKSTPEGAERLKIYNRENSRKQRNTREKWCMAILRKIKKRCKDRGIAFNLTVDDLLEVFPLDEKCPILNTPLVYGEGNRRNPSVDRIKASGGYVKGNIAIISMRANAMKYDGNSKELLKVAQWVARAENGDISANKEEFLPGVISVF